MLPREMVAALKAANIEGRYEAADDPESEDDQIVLAPGVTVQIGYHRGGPFFVATVEEGAGDDFGVRYGRETRDPVAAAREALLLANG